MTVCIMTEHLTWYILYCCLRITISLQRDKLFHPQYFISQEKKTRNKKIKIISHILFIVFHFSLKWISFTSYININSDISFFELKISIFIEIHSIVRKYKVFCQNYELSPFGQINHRIFLTQSKELVHFYSNPNTS